MKAAQWINAITLATAATLGLTLGVVCILYAFHLDASPRIRQEWPLLLGVTAVFAALAAAAGAAFLGQRRTWPRRAWVQLMLYVAVPAAAWALVALLT